MDEFTHALEARWRQVDLDDSGTVTRHELRLAVWNYEPENRGVPLPEQLPVQMQDVLDEIVAGTGNRNEFTFWHFVPFVLESKEAIDGLRVPVPPRNCGWAHINEAYNNTPFMTPREEAE